MEQIQCIELIMKFSSHSNINIDNRFTKSCTQILFVFSYIKLFKGNKNYISFDINELFGLIRLIPRYFSQICRREANITFKLLQKNEIRKEHVIKR